MIIGVQSSYHTLGTILGSDRGKIQIMELPFDSVNPVPMSPSITEHKANGRSCFDPIGERMKLSGSPMGGIRVLILNDGSHARCLPGRVLGDTVSCFCV